MRGRIIHGWRRLPRVALGGLALLAMAAGGCAASAASATTPPPSPPASASCAGEFDEAEVTAVLERQREHWNRGELDGFLAGYEESEALLFTSGAQVRRGFAQTRDKYRARYGEARETMGTLTFEILDVRGLGQCKDAAIVLGRWRLRETQQAGEGIFSVILERQGPKQGSGGEWKIVHDHTSAKPAETPEP